MDMFNRFVFIESLFRYRIAGYVRGMTAALMLLAAVPAGADVYYAMGDGGTNLYQIDQTTGAATLVQNVSTTANPTFALAATPDGMLWSADIWNSQLVQIDPATGTATRVFTDPAFALGQIDMMAGDASGKLYGLDNTSGFFYIIDPVAQTVTTISTIHPALCLSGLAFDSAGTLYGVDPCSIPLALYTFNTTTGVATFQRSISGITSSVDIGLAIDPYTNAAYLNRRELSSGIYTLDLATGVAALVASSGAGDLTGAVIAHDRVPPVVTPPANITLTSDLPVPVTNATIVAFLMGATATDNLDGPIALVINDAPVTFTTGTTTVTFSATDAAGNIGTATATVTVNNSALVSALTGGGCLLPGSDASQWSVWLMILALMLAGIGWMRRKNI